MFSGILPHHSDFYPRSPCGERPKDQHQAYLRYQFLSTLSLRRATRLGLLGWLRTLISIHALLAESDRAVLREHGKSLYFYPRSPCGERLPLDEFQDLAPDISIHALLAESDCITTTIICTAWRFLSTLSLRRATRRKQPSFGNYIHFYPRSPCGERHSISSVINNIIDNFYPRSPCGERLISPHSAPDNGNFYPRSPCGERLDRVQETLAPKLFLSTLSLRRATAIATTATFNMPISIHALLAESDLNFPAGRYIIS